MYGSRIVLKVKYETHYLFTGNPMQGEVPNADGSPMQGGALEVGKLGMKCET